MGQETLSAFFLKVQTVEESFLLLVPTERCRALNILQSSLNKLLSFLGDNSALNATATVSVGLDANGYIAADLENKSKKIPQTHCSDSSSPHPSSQIFSAKTRGKRKAAGQTKRAGNGRSPKKSNLCSDVGGAVFSSSSSHACTGGKSVVDPDASQQRTGLKGKENFEDDFQELADFECPYDFGPGLAQGGSAAVSVSGPHLPACDPKYGQTMHDMPAPTACTTSQSHYGQQVMGVSATQSLNLTSCNVTDSQYGEAALSAAVPGVKGGCGMGQDQYPSIISTPSVATGQENPQYAGAVLDMSTAQGVQTCDPTDSLSQFAGVVLSAPQLTQSAALCASSQYRGAVLSISAPDTYSASPYGQSILHGSNTITAHSHFSDTVLDMSAAASASRQCESALSVSQSHSHSQYSGSVFEGPVLAAQHGYRKTIFDGTATEQCQVQSAQNLPQPMAQVSSHGINGQVAVSQPMQNLSTPPVFTKWRTFECGGCGEVLTHYRSIKAHLLSHGSNPLSCRFCRQVQVNETAWSHHICGGLDWKRISVISREILLCLECGKSFTTKNILKSHMASEHCQEMPADVQFTCRFCRLQFTTTRTLFSHYRLHVGDRFVCSLCGAILNDFVQFAGHMLCHEKRRRKLTCQLCNERFSSGRVLMQHLSQHAGHICVFCQKHCRSKLVLERHKKKLHKAKVMRADASTKKELECGVCEKRFTRTRELEVHSRLHTGEKPVYCTLCSMSFHTPRALAKHRQTLGHCKRAGKSRERLHLCSECGKSYFRRPALLRHLRKHQTSKPYACQFCSFKCRERDNLQRHAARHFSTERNFICELCGAAFHAKKTLEIHHSYKHSSERRYKCPDCPMTFKARNALGRHAKIHSRTREHGCWCGAAFNRLYNLRRHMRLVHGSDEALPPIRRVEVLDHYQSVKQPVSTRPAKKMIVKTRKVKADCMQKEQEAAAAAVVVVVGGDDDGGSGGVEGGDGSGRAMERDDVQVMPQVGLPLSDPEQQQQQVGLQGVDTFTTMSAAASGGMVQPNVLHSLSHVPHHLTMEQSYAMVSATLHHHHHHHDPQQPLAGTSGTDPAVTSHPHSHPFPHLSHPALDYGQLQGLTTMVPYSSNITLTNSTTPTTMTDNNVQRQPEYYGTGGSTLEGLQQSTGDYTSQFSFIQNFLLPSVGVANLLDLAHASSAK